jgi:hypothetical protein
MLNLSRYNIGAKPVHFSADAGYFSAANVTFCEARDVDAYVPAKRVKHGDVNTPAPMSSDGQLTAKEKMTAKLATAQGRAVYARRKAIAEPPFGQIKAARGFRRFSLRGLEKVRCEWSLVCATHNLLKLFRSLSPSGGSLKEKAF